MSSFYWLSFRDADRPPGERFLGAAVVGPAESLLVALFLSHLFHCNPGGEVLMCEVPPEHLSHIPLTCRNRLLSQTEAAALSSVLN